MRVEAFAEQTHEHGSENAGTFSARLCAALWKGIDEEQMRKKCFVIIPFSRTSIFRSSKYWDRFFERLRNIFDELGYDAFRSEDSPHSLTKAILQDLAMTDLVIAILTDRNPNVWYELGIRNSNRHGTIMAIQEGQKLPFDIDDYGVIYYNIQNKKGFERLKIKIQSYISKLEQNVNDSPVSEFLNTDIQNTVNIALGKLREASQLIITSFNANKTPSEILDELRMLQRSWKTNVKGQITIVDRAKVNPRPWDWE
ncbi:MAG: hypothetical protein JRF30_10535 [Deltaproteobacteria bacterium]|nr:hypothetical protein [Deltaproteobacteria bacterium]MBW2331332.1 hypothetical protein [Deltaproteobacteria bacterium]